MTINNKISICAILSALLLSGCAPVLVGSAAIGTTSVVADRRTAGDVANDNVIEAKAALQLAQSNFSSSHITCTSFEGTVLLTGEVGTEEDKLKAGEIASAINGVNLVYNELAVMPNNSLSGKLNDTVLASKVRAALVDNKQVTITAVKVVVDRNICYLMGAVTSQEAEIISIVASKVPGIVRVVKLFKIISAEELDRRTVFKGTQENSSTNNSSGNNSSDSDQNPEVTTNPVP